MQFISQKKDIRNFFPQTEASKAKHNKYESFSSKQNMAYECFKNGENIFITGQGGCGKSYWVKKMYEDSKENNKRISVTALTGCAAILLECNATTIHTWGSIGIGNDTFDNTLKKIRMYKKKDNWLNTDILIIDEISMMSQYVFEMIDYIARKIRRSSKPFGGIQIVCCGDFYQLPPVTHDKTMPEKRQFCFESPIWDNTFQRMFIFDQNFRQSDDKNYMDILQEIRDNNLSIDNIEHLLACTKKNVDDCPDPPTLLYPLKRMSDEYNKMEFESLESENIIEYTAELYKKTEEGNYEILNKKTKANEALKMKYFSNFMLEPTLKLCVGCKVMVTSNLDFEAGIVNGSQGKIIEFEVNGLGKKYPIVEFEQTGIRRTIQPHSWTVHDGEFKVEQIPLILSWAITIHKSQGITLTNARINLGSSVFEYGQSYVALSRVKSLDGLYLDAINFKKIKTNPKVVKFYKEISKYDTSC